MFPFADFRYWHASDRIGGGRAGKTHEHQGPDRRSQWAIEKGSVEIEPAPTTPTKGPDEQNPTRHSPYGECGSGNCLIRSRAVRLRWSFVWEANT